MGGSIPFLTPWLLGVKAVGFSPPKVVKMEWQKIDDVHVDELWGPNIRYFIRCSCGEYITIFEPNEVYTCPKCGTRFRANLEIQWAEALPKEEPKPEPKPAPKPKKPRKGKRAKTTRKNASP